MIDEFDKVFLLQTLNVARQGLGFCAPNPAVGAIIVKEQKIIVTGYHAVAGAAHAEVVALLNCSAEEAANATLYVSLEPCCHWGKTPPCTELIINKKIGRVVFGHHDKNLVVNGQGYKILQQAGIPVDYLPLPEFQQFYQAYDHWLSTKKPTIDAKIAMSLDGKIAGEAGTPITITGKALQDFTHQQRFIHDALLTTANTILADNPQLNVRLSDTVTTKSLYVLDRQLRISSQANLFNTTKAVTIFYNGRLSTYSFNKLKIPNVTYIAVSCENAYLNWQEIISYIGKQGIHSLWVEAGGTCFQSLLKHRLLTSAYIYVSPKWLGSQAVPAFSEAINLTKDAKNISWQAFDDEVLCRITWE